MMMYMALILHFFKAKVDILPVLFIKYIYQIEVLVLFLLRNYMPFFGGLA